MRHWSRHRERGGGAAYKRVAVYLAWEETVPKQKTGHQRMLRGQPASAAARAKTMGVSPLPGRSAREPWAAQGRGKKKDVAADRRPRWVGGPGFFSRPAGARPAGRGAARPVPPRRCHLAGATSSPANGAETRTGAPSARQRITAAAGRLTGRGQLAVLSRRRERKRMTACHAVSAVQPEQGIPSS